jgi:hypothetical protein
MSKITVFKNDQGKLEGWGEVGKRAYAKFARALAALEPGEMLEWEYRVPRAPKPHRFYFVMVKSLHDTSEQFENENDLRLWLLIGIGHCSFAPGAHGRMCAIPKTMNWASLSEEEFHDIFDRTFTFLWSDKSRRFLWPNQTDEQTFETVQRFVDDLERDRAIHKAKADRLAAQLAANPEARAT